jgi:hypothetical protein
MAASEVAACTLRFEVSSVVLADGPANRTYTWPA